MKKFEITVKNSEYDYVTKKDTFGRAEKCFSENDL